MPSYKLKVMYGQNKSQYLVAKSYLEYCVSLMWHSFFQTALSYVAHLLLKTFDGLVFSNKRAANILVHTCVHK